MLFYNEVLMFGPISLLPKRKNLLFLFEERKQARKKERKKERNEDIYSVLKLLWSHFDFWMKAQISSEASFST